MSLGGHPRPLWFERRTGEVRAVGEPGTAVGLLPEPVLRETRITLRPGDVLVLFTDGCVDVRTQSGTVSDETLLFDGLRQHALEGVVELTGHLAAAVLASNGGRTADDAALLVLRAQGDVRRTSTPARSGVGTRQGADR
jgi:serine phosphatase RsbU (regulator of sigma subunit)